jgi:tetratricopeptide (TPR) repeat protein
LLGEKQKALEYYNHGLSLWRAMSDRKAEASMLDNIGKLYDSLGESQKALGYFNQALPLRQVTGDRFGESSTLINIGRIYSLLGEWRVCHTQ